MSPRSSSVIHERSRNSTSGTSGSRSAARGSSSASDSGDFLKRGGGAAERFDYLYSDDELSEWIGPLRELSEQAEQAYAFFNNNATSPDGRGGRMAQAAANARELQRLLQAEKVPVSAPS